MRISDKVRKAIFERDGWRCPHCGETEAIGLQHRIGKGMGGSKLLDLPSNLLTFCNIGNAALESNSHDAERGRRFGWKMSRFSPTAPEDTAYFDLMTKEWILLDNSFGRRVAI